MSLIPGNVYSHPDLATMAFMLIWKKRSKDSYELGVLWIHKKNFHEYAQDRIRVSDQFVNQLTDNGPIEKCKPMPVFNMGSDYERRYSARFNKKPD